MADHGYPRVRYASLSIVLSYIMMLYCEIHLLMIIKGCVDLLVNIGTGLLTRHGVTPY